MAQRIDFWGHHYRNARRPILTKAASYTLTAADNGCFLTVTAVATITLPAVAGSKGLEFTIFNVADAALTVAAPTGTLVVFNNAAATSIAFSTTAEKIGSGVTVVCDGALWYAQVHLAAESVTPTIA